MAASNVSRGGHCKYIAGLLPLPSKRAGMHQAEEG